MQIRISEKLSFNLPQPLSNIYGWASVFILSLLISGCNFSSASDAKEIAGINYTELQPIIDWSISTEDEPMREFIRSFAEHLPEIAEQYAISNVTAFQFGKDGWIPTKILSIELPSLNQAETGEIGQMMPKVKERKAAEMVKQYRAQMRERLSQINIASLAPPKNTPEPPCTDLNGVFKRIASIRSKHRRIFVVATDGHESCANALGKVSVPTNATALVIVLLPEKPERKVSSMAYQQFEKRSEEIRQALSWAVVIPPTEDLLSAIGEAFAKAEDSKPQKQ